MTRSYAARRLLALGPLSRQEFAEIAGWPNRSVRNVLKGLVENGSVEYVGNTQKGKYYLSQER